jgi:anti-sigma factor RsiW
MSNCDELGQLLHEYADGEIDELGKCLVEAHLLACNHCTGQLDQIYNLRVLLGSSGLRCTAPRYLRRTVERSSTAAPMRVAERIASWLVPAAAGAVAATLVPLFAHPGAGDAPIEQELVESHVRSLQANHLVDVATSSEYSVGPWFNGKIDFAPHAPDVAAGEFRLLGCRLDYARGHALAALVYARADHKVNLFVWPAPAEADKLLERQGYAIVEWSKGGLRYAAVSDASVGDLVQLSAAFKKVERSRAG